MKNRSFEVLCHKHIRIGYAIVRDSPPYDVPPSPDISHPAPSPDITHPALDTGWERKAFQLPRSDISGSSDSAYPENFAAILHMSRCSPEASRYVINFVDYSPSEDHNQGTPAGHESAETPIGNVSLSLQWMSHGQPFEEATYSSRSISAMARIRGGHTDPSVSREQRSRAFPLQDSTHQASTVPSFEGAVPSSPPQRPGESSRHSLPDPQAPTNSQRPFGISPEAIIKRPMVTALPIEGNSNCKAKPFHSELYFDIEAMRRHPKLQDSFGLLQRYHLESLMTPKEFFYPRVAMDFYQSMTTQGARVLRQWIQHISDNGPLYLSGRWSASYLGGLLEIHSFYCEARSHPGRAIQDIRGLLFRATSPDYGRSPPLLGEGSQEEAIESRHYSIVVSEAALSHIRAHGLSY
ncbi:hypothetical protein CK203_055620 [Vitis vinifera]|uniref:Uncharacterized protein n=1 Tax=Vitis vinifera TaxID=29760 RepID=A0A438FV63_VITVI|nr:hypothetical protein CK203_055620 [Vitis vinifera]